MRPTSVLIVDDDRMMLRLLRTVLKQMHIHDVAEATDGLEALEQLRARPIDLIISDWHMHPMTGYDLLLDVRAQPGLAQLPFIMLAAECAPERVGDARRAGVSGYVIKPFDAEVLRSEILAACAHD